MYFASLVDFPGFERARVKNTRNLFKIKKEAHPLGTVELALGTELFLF